MLYRHGAIVELQLVEALTGFGGQYTMPDPNLLVGERSLSAKGATK